MIQISSRKVKCPRRFSKTFSLPPEKVVTFATLFFGPKHEQKRSRFRAAKTNLKARKVHLLTQFLPPVDRNADLR